MARLVIFDDTVRGVDLSGHPVILGRSRSADIPIRDRLLSRKHCALVPGEGCFQLVDLKSSHGTFLNGIRVDKGDVHFEDIIEIGTTVMVLLNTEHWKKGDGLPRVRHPDKAKALIESIKRREVASRDFKREMVLSSAKNRASSWLRQKKVLTPEETEALEWAGRNGLGGAPVRKLLEEYLTHQVVSLMIRHVPDLGPKLSAVVERILRTENLAGGEEEFRKAVRLALDEELQGTALPPDSPQDGEPDNEPDGAAK
jgi:pSer/pThr/pTyr-binding forkhead associated (FHA) protein